jgi:hypothetical protein
VEAKQPKAKPLKRSYVSVVFFFLGRALQASTHILQYVHDEVKHCPQGFSFALDVIPQGPSMVVKHTGDGNLCVFKAKQYKESPDVLVKFKNIEDAYIFLTGSESPYTAFAKNRMIAYGDLSQVLTLLRCFNYVRAVGLPAFVLGRSMHCHDGWSFGRKQWTRVRLYMRTILGY